MCPSLLKKSIAFLQTNHIIGEDKNPANHSYLMLISVKLCRLAMEFISATCIPCSDLL